MTFKKKPIPLAIKRAVAIRHGAIPGERSSVVHCHYCGKQGEAHWPRNLKGEPGGWVAIRGFDLDHVIPEFHGGSTTDPDNFVLACARCNRSKGHRYATPPILGGIHGTDH